MPWHRAFTSTTIGRAGGSLAAGGRCLAARRRLILLETGAMWRRGWERVRGDEGQNVSEYALLLVLLVLCVVAAVHAIGVNAQEVINRVNTALAGS